MKESIGLIAIGISMKVIRGADGFSAVIGGTLLGFGLLMLIDARIERLTGKAGKL